MGEAIGGSLALAIGVALSLVPIIAVVLMLSTKRARVNGLVFVAGWLAGLAVIGAIVLCVAGPASASSSGSPASWVSWLKKDWMSEHNTVIMSVLCLVIGVKLIGDAIAGLTS